MLNNIVIQHAKKNRSLVQLQLKWSYGMSNTCMTSGMVTVEVLVHDGRPWTRMSRKVNGSTSFKGPTECVLSLFLSEEPALSSELTTSVTDVLSSAKLS